MPRSIVTGSRVVPWGEIDGSPVPGPDEDAFTQTVAAIDLMTWPLSPSPLRRLHLFGPFPAELTGDLGEAIGRPDIEVPPPQFASKFAAGLASLLQGSSDEVEAAVLLSAPETDDPSSGPPKVSETIAVGLSNGIGARFRGFANPLTSSHDDQVRRLVQLLRSTAVGNPEQTDGPNRPPVVGEEFELDGTPFWTEGSPPPGGRFHWESPEAYRRTSSADPSDVSEGAYLPLPTYRAHRPGRWRLVAGVCRSCGTRSFPWIGSCPNCGRTDQLERHELPRTALEVEATTVVHPGAQPSEFDRSVGATGSYEVVIARVDGHVRVTLPLTGAPSGAVRIGDRIDAVLRRLFPLEGAWRYGLKAIPSTSPAHRQT